MQAIEKQQQILKNQEEQINALNKRFAALELKIRKTDNEKCPKCETIESALEENHLTCYKWHFSKLAKPAIFQLFKDAWENGHLEVAKFLVESGANIHADNDYAFYAALKKKNMDMVNYLVSIWKDT